MFPEYYRSFLGLWLCNGPVSLYHYFDAHPSHIEVVKPILNIVLYIPSIWPIQESVSIVAKQDVWTSQVCEYYHISNDYAYACIAVLGMIVVPEDLIRSTLETNLTSKELEELYKYTNLHSYMNFNIGESLHLFKLIKRFHERGLSTDPRFPNMQLAIINSLFKFQTWLKPEYAVAQTGYYNPVNFSAWTNVVNLWANLIRIEYNQVVDFEHEPLPPVADIINIFRKRGQFVTGDRNTNYDMNSIYVNNPIMKDILTGLINGAGMEMPTLEYDDHVAVTVRMKLSRFELLRASFENLHRLSEYYSHYTDLLMRK